MRNEEDRTRMRKIESPFYLPHSSAFFGPIFLFKSGVCKKIKPINKSDQLVSQH